MKVINGGDLFKSFGGLATSMWQIELLLCEHAGAIRIARTKVSWCGRCGAFSPKPGEWTPPTYSRDAATTPSPEGGAA